MKLMPLTFAIVLSIISTFISLNVKASTNSEINSNGDLVTVSYVDVGRYLGAWYQIAKNPLFFEGNCACARQLLSPGINGRIDVYNSCNDVSPSGPLREIRGFAFSNDPVSNAKLTVDFNLPQTGQYWIIALDHDYRYAVVSDPSRRSLYILSKTPALSDELYERAVSEAALQLDISKLEKQVQLGCSYPH